MFAKETIVADLLDRIRDHPDSPTVTEDLEKIGNLGFLPQVLVVEGPDTVLKISMSHGETIETRQAMIFVVSFVQADTNELGPAAMRNFQNNLRKVIYQNERRSIGVGANIRETTQSQMVPAPSENCVYAQQLTFKVEYKNNVSALFDTVIPTT